MARGRRAPAHHRARHRRRRPGRSATTSAGSPSTGSPGSASGSASASRRPPAALAAEADRLGFPVLTVPYEVPFIALTKAVASHLANEELERVTAALAVHERLARGGARRPRRPGAARGALRSRSAARSRSWTRPAASWRAARRRSGSLRATRSSCRSSPTARRPPSGRRATSGELQRVRPARAPPRPDGARARASRRRAVSAAELRLAGDLLEDLEHDRLDDRELARRMAAFGLEPERTYAALLAVGPDGGPSRRRGSRVAARARRAAASRYLSAARRDRAAFLLESPRRGGGARARAGARRGRAGRACRRRPAGARPRARPQPARGAGGARRGRRPGRLLPRPRLARAPARPAERRARGVRRPRARPGRRERRGSSSRSPRSSTPAVAGATPPSGSASTGTRCATAWSGSASRPAAIPTTPRSGWSSGSPSRRGRRCRRASRLRRCRRHRDRPPAEVRGTVRRRARSSATMRACPDRPDRRRPPELPRLGARAPRGGGFRGRRRGRGRRVRDRGVARLQPDVVLLDVQLPDIDGFEVCQRCLTTNGSTRSRARLEPRRAPTTAS